MVLKNKGDYAQLMPTTGREHKNSNVSSAKTFAITILFFPTTPQRVQYVSSTIMNLRRQISLFVLDKCHKFCSNNEAVIILHSPLLDSRVYYCSF